jgi:creatinine amidohydrolase/Fe(II)-dependent formamide hydrolase-like protein
LRRANRRALGNAIVAPVVTYVPEGSWERPTGHMSKAGSITLPEERFRTLLELIARSLRGSGFKEIILIGDSGGNQNGMNAVATKLNASGRALACAFTSSATTTQRRTRCSRTGSPTAPRSFRATPSEGTRTSWTRPSCSTSTPSSSTPDRYAIANSANGVSGSPAKSTREIGKKLLDIKIALALAQIRQSLAAAPAGAEKF